MSSSSSQQDQPSTPSAAMNLQSLQHSFSQFQQSTNLEFSSNPVEIANHIKSLSQHELIKIVEIKNCPTTLEASKLISNSIFKSSVEPLKNLIIIIMKINEQLNEQHAEKPKIHEFKIEGNFLISYESQKAANEKIIYWKNGKEGNYLTINMIKGYSAEMTDFVRNFLSDNVFMSYDKSINNNFELVNLNNSNNLNLFMKAVESEQTTTLINELLHLPFDIDQKSNDGKTAADIAYEKKNNQILLQLLEENSTFPTDFNIAELEIDEALKGIEGILNDSRNLHEAIAKNDLTNVQKTIDENLNLRYFYNSSNVSAATVALNAKAFETYNFLLKNECSIGPNEDFNHIIDEICENYEENEPRRKQMKWEITNAHDNVSKSLPEKHLLILCVHSKICHDDQHDKYRLKIIREAFNNLNLINNNFYLHNENSITKQILQLTAMHKNFKIYFDFNRTSIQFMNPYGGDQFTNGLNVCYTKINKACLYIAAKELLSTDADDKFAALGILAQELCHFAMNMTFSNDTKPYAIDDKQNEKEFNKVIGKCKVSPLVILNCTEQIEKLQELIAFSENLLQKSPDELNEKVNDYEVIICDNNKIVANNQEQMEIIDNEKLIEEYVEKLQLCKSNHQASITEYKNEISKLEEEIKDVKARSDYEEIVSLVFTHYEQSKWPSELIVRVPHMIAHYQNNPQRLSELKETEFKELFDYYDKFVQPEISKTKIMLEKLFKNPSEIKYNDLTDAYKAKIHHSNVNFQGVEVKFNKIIEDKNSEIFQHLSSKQICGILIENECAQEVKTKFYVERDFIDYDIKTEKTWNDKFTKLDWPEKVLNNLKNFDQISSIAVATKMILLSDHAGAGKTTTFKNLSVKLKEEFPHFWISYIDLKRYLKVYEKFVQNFQVFEVLKEILSITDEFEVEIFTKFFNSHKVILLYDGVDEIAPKFKDFFIKFIESVRNSTNNQQWIATRPQHMQELKVKFNQRAYKLLPYDEKMKIELIENVLKNLKNENIKAKYVLTDIGIMTSYRNDIDSPLMLQMMTELYVNDKTILRDSNKFSLYDRMIEMKKDIVEEKGKIVNKDRDYQSKLTIWQIHQIYALKLLYKDGFKDRLNDDKTIDINEFPLLKRWKKEKSKWTPEAISRYGFLYVDYWNTNDEFSDFVHRTFAEFFVAQFTIQDLYELDEDDDDEMSKKEIEMRIKLLIDTRLSLSNPINTNFISSFIDIQKTKKMHKHFTKLITTNEMQKILTFTIEDDDDKRVHNDFVKIFSIDERFLKDLRFNENMTIFQYYVNHSDIKNIFEIVEIYKRSLGVDWIYHTGYSAKENFSMPNYKEIYEILKQESKKYEEDSDQKYSEFKKLFEFFNSIDQLEIPQNHLLKFFGKNFDEISYFAFDSSLLTQNLMKFIQNYFHNCKREFLKTISKNIKFYTSFRGYTEDYEIKFIHDLEDFFLSDETICVDDIKYFTIKLYFRYCEMIGLIKSYTQNKFTKSEIQNFFIKHSVEIINYMSEYVGYSNFIEDFIIFFKQIFNVESERSQLKKFLDMLCEDESRFLPYVENQSIFSNLDNSEISFDNEIFSVRIKRFRLLRATLLELAKEIEIPDDEFEKLSRRLKNEKIK